MPSPQVRVNEKALAAVRRRFPNQASRSNAELVNWILWWSVDAEASEATSSQPVKTSDDHEYEEPPLNVEVDSLKELTADEVEF